MCFQYLNRFFTGSRAHRPNVAHIDLTPRPSLADVSQVSVDTVRSTRSAKSAKSAKSAMSARSLSLGNAAIASCATINLENQLVPPNGGSVSTEVVEMAKVESTVAPESDIPAAGSVAPSAGPALSSAGTLGATGGNSRSLLRGSWWKYFGMNKKKKSSIDSM